MRFHEGLTHQAAALLFRLVGFPIGLERLSMLLYLCDSRSVLQSSSPITRGTYVRQESCLVMQELGPLRDKYGHLERFIPANFGEDFGKMSQFRCGIIAWCWLCYRKQDDAELFKLIERAHPEVRSAIVGQEIDIRDMIRTVRPNDVDEIMQQIWEDDRTHDFFHEERPIQ